MDIENIFINWEIANHERMQEYYDNLETNEGNDNE